MPVHPLNAGIAKTLKTKAFTPERNHERRSCIHPPPFLRKGEVCEPERADAPRESLIPSTAGAHASHAATTDSDRTKVFRRANHSCIRALRLALSAGSFGAPSLG